MLLQNLPSLESLDLSSSYRLIELPDLSGTPNLKSIDLLHCKSLPHLHPSISSLRKLEYLRLYGCTAFKRLWGSNGQASLPPASNCSSFQELSFMSDRITNLMFGVTAMTELPSSILHLRNLGRFEFSICNALMELPENFAQEIALTDPIENDCDTFITLRTVLQSPGFRYVKALFFFYCSSLFDLPGSISLLSSLQLLYLYGSHIKSLPASIKHLPRLMVVSIGFCERLLSIPELPPSVQVLNVWDCASLKAVSSSTREPPKRNRSVFLFQNCIKLDHDSLETILKDALVRIKLGVSALSFEDKEDAHTDDILSDEKICICIPAGSIQVQNWLNYYSREALITMEIPLNSKFSGLVFCLVFSQGQSFLPDDTNLGCHCYFETRGDQRLCTTSFFQNNWFSSLRLYGRRLDSDHVFLWYDAKFCEMIIKAISAYEAINDGGVTDNPRLTFAFFTQSLNPDGEHKDAMIKECWLHLIHPTDDHVAEEEGRRKSKRIMEIHELKEPKPSAARKGLECCDEHKGEQKELVPPAKKFRQ